MRRPLRRRRLPIPNGLYPFLLPRRHPGKRRGWCCLFCSSPANESAKAFISVLLQPDLPSFVLLGRRSSRSQFPLQRPASAVLLPTGPRTSETIRVATESPCPVSRTAADFASRAKPGTNRPRTADRRLSEPVACAFAGRPRAAPGGRHSPSQPPRGRSAGVGRIERWTKRSQACCPDCSSPSHSKSTS